MITREQILEFIRDDECLDSLTQGDREEIIIAMCSNDDDLECLIEDAIKQNSWKKVEE